MTNRPRLMNWLFRFRFLAIFAVVGALFQWTETGINRVAESVSQRVFHSTSIEDGARLETDALHFFTTAQFFANGQNGVTRRQLDLAFDLMWARVKMMAQPNALEADMKQRPDPAFILEFAAALPEMESGAKMLRPGEPQSFEKLATLHRRFYPRLAVYGEFVWNARRSLGQAGIAQGMVNVLVLRWIQAGFAMVAMLSVAYALFELAMSHRLNVKLRALVKQNNAMLRMDYLTGASNRHHFDEVLAERLASQKRNFSLLYFDLDGFKQVNDRHGHAAGDALLRQVASCLQNAAGTHDLVARFGGDEFAVLLSGDMVKALAFATSVLDTLRTASEGGMQVFAVSASAGICHASQLHQTDTSDTLQKRADLALYAAKAAGRNCVRIYAPDMEKAKSLRAEWTHEMARPAV